MLLEHGADVNIADGNGHSMAASSTLYGSRVAAVVDKWLKKKGGTVPPLSESNKCDCCSVEGKSFKKCARCKTAQYCSKNCQSKLPSSVMHASSLIMTTLIESAWKAHKLRCDPFNISSTITVVPFYAPDAWNVPSDAIRRGMAGLPTDEVPKSHWRGNYFPDDLPLEGKQIVIKVQVPMLGDRDVPLKVYSRKRDFVCFLRWEDGPKAYDDLTSVIKTKGVGGVKGYFVADLKNRDELTIKISEILGAQPW